MDSTLAFVILGVFVFVFAGALGGSTRRRDLPRLAATD
jgi:hypothetical protein